MKERRTVIWIEDGQRIVGKSSVVDETETETEDVFTDETNNGDKEAETIVTIGSIEYYLNKVQANKADADANDYHSKAEWWNNKLDQLKSAVSELEEKNKKLKKARSFWKNNSSIFVVFLGLIGFFCGAIIAIKKYLEIQGPTETVAGTLGAWFVYGVSGVIGAFIFGALVKMIVAEIITYHTETLKENFGLLDDLKLNEGVAKNQVKKYLNLENEARAEARKYRGL
ncbi:hypothetical protein J6V85_04380 [Candidatus Saccharibacteria bacterium]|nr:hypothetical protein [Candidatus Saccharibacteria bacterium]